MHALPATVSDTVRLLATHAIGAGPQPDDAT